MGVLTSPALSGSLGSGGLLRSCCLCGLVLTPWSGSVGTPSKSSFFPSIGRLAWLPIPPSGGMGRGVLAAGSLLVIAVTCFASFGGMGLVVCTAGALMAIRGRGLGGWGMRSVEFTPSLNS